MAERGRYLYAVTRDLAAAGPRARSPVWTAGRSTWSRRTVWPRSSATWTSTVYGEQGLREHLEDLTWLERVARRHDDVVHAVAAARPDRAAAAGHHLPRRRRGAQPARGVARRRCRQALDRVEGRSEWSVKAYARPRAAAAGNGARAPPTSPGAGAAYLQRKRAQTDERRTAEEAGVTAATQIHAALASTAVASRLLAAQDPRLTGHEGTMTLNGAYLVADQDADAFVAETQRQAAAHDEVRLEVHGPWPPYSFATLDQP